MSSIKINCNFCSYTTAEEGDDLDVLAVIKRSDEHMAKAHPESGGD